MIKVSRYGIEIDHGDRDISVAVDGGLINIGIGINYSDEGYEHWAEIHLTVEEAREFSDWLSKNLETDK